MRPANLKSAGTGMTLLLALVLLPCAPLPAAASGFGAAPATTEAAGDLRAGAADAGTGTKTTGETEHARDPWQPFNRRMHAFNRGLDRYLAKPLARGYLKVVPRPIRTGVGNFFINLFQPLTAAHQILQGKPAQAGTSIGRFLLNVVLGVGGVFDPASDAGIPLRQEDLGQTLAVWGWKESNYLVLPFLGPSTTRDGFGTVGDSFASPYRIPEDDEVKYGLRGLQLVSDRAGLLGAEEFIKDAEDEYLIFRDAYLQRRRFQIEDGRDQTPDYLLDAYDFEDFEDTDEDAGEGSPVDEDG